MDINKNYFENINNLLLSNNNIHFIGIKFDKNIKIKIINDTNYYIVGSDYENEIGINEKTFEIYSLSNDEIYFINNSLEKLINCIKYFNQKIDLDTDNYEEKERHKIIEGIRNGINKIDAKALSDKNNWWSLILEQAMDGLL